MTPADAVQYVHVGSRCGEQYIMYFDVLWYTLLSADVSRYT